MVVKSSEKASGAHRLRALMVRYVLASLGVVATILAIAIFTEMRAGQAISMSRLDILSWAVLGLASPHLAVLACWRAWAFFVRPDPGTRKTSLQLAGGWFAALVVFLPTLLWEPTRPGMGDGTAGLIIFPIGPAISPLLAVVGGVAGTIVSRFDADWSGAPLVPQLMLTAFLVFAILAMPLAIVDRFGFAGAIAVSLGVLVALAFWLRRVLYRRRTKDGGRVRTKDAGR